ncbi:hypothetical protein EKG38_11270 [Shewanella canadensis]|uniref:Uncharacterized protein n=1 Tax=Shewanella canadensis TaxID=271096 RepID=A0A431WSY8_9GAMM|nr:hypothetical protein [Shewanella canadensis]RTR38742.1 hypothetical protein EKG38_11270 [Shewanella canadensis]
MNKWFLVIFTVLLAGLAPSVASSERQVLRHIEALSRDNYYVDIDDPTVPFQARDIVGGEHENEYHILGFQGDTFIIVVQSIEGEAGYSLRGDGYDRQREELGDIVTVKDRHTWISIGVSAHPYAEYILTVKKNE